MNDNVYLVGNPNSGKTTLFNRLTGKSEKTGNRAGVTVDKSSAKYKKNKNVLIVDLPGPYPLSGFSIDETIASTSIINNPPKAIINVLDGNNLERGLFLTAQLLKLKIPLVLAINFCDELKRKKISVNQKYLENVFGCKVVLISALKKINIDKVVSVALNNNVIPKEFDERYYKNTQLLYEKLEEIVAFAVKTDSVEIKPTKIENILLNRYFAFPIFFAVMLFLRLF